LKLACEERDTYNLRFALMQLFPHVGRLHQEVLTIILEQSKANLSVHSAERTKRSDLFEGSTDYDDWLSQ